MHAIILVFVLLWAVIAAISIIVPTIAAKSAALFVGKIGKLEHEDKKKLPYFFYGIMGVLFGIVSLMDGESIGNTILNMILWPVGLVIQLVGGFNARENMIFTGILILSFVSVQLIAIIMVIRRANQETNL